MMFSTIERYPRRMMREVCKRATRMGPTIPWDGCCPDGVEEEEDGELDSMIVLIKGKGN